MLNQDQHLINANHHIAAEYVQRRAMVGWEKATVCSSFKRMTRTVASTRYSTSSFCSLSFRQNDMIPSHPIPIDPFPSSISIKHSQSDQVNIPDEREEVVWEKVLWRKQPFPDNHVPPSFLSELNDIRECFQCSRCSLWLDKVWSPLCPG